MTTVAAGPTREPRTWLLDLREGARTLGTVTAVGLVAGWFVVGVVSRLAMFLLVTLNPVAVGLLSDDGFEMGRFTLSGSLSLMFSAGTALGVLGAGAYAALRGLRVGPAWFRLLSISVGGGVVVGSQVVHTDGVDFRVLDPPWLAVGLFVLVPVLYVALLSAVSESLLARSVPTPVWVAGLLAWAVVFPLLPLVVLLAVGHVALRAARRSTALRGAVTSPVGPWLLRVVLAAVFAAAVIELVREVAELS